MTPIPKPTKAQRDVIVKIRMTEAEKTQLKEVAKRERTTLARLIREAVLQEAKDRHKNVTYKQVIVHAADPALVREVARIGNNINQIARKANAGFASHDEVTRALRMLDAVYGLLYEAGK